MFLGGSDRLENLLATRTVHAFKYSSKLVGGNKNSEAIVSGSTGIDVGAVLHQAAVAEGRIPAGDGFGSGKIAGENVFSDVMMGELAGITKLFDKRGETLVVVKFV